MASVLSSRLLSAVTHLQSAFEEARGYAKYHPSRGYWWDFTAGKNTNTTITTQLANLGSSDNKGQGASEGTSINNGSKTGEKKPKSNKNKEVAQDREEPGSMFQRRRVDMILDLWMRNFPPKVQSGTVTQAVTSNVSNAVAANNNSGNIFSLLYMILWRNCIKLR